MESRHTSYYVKHKNPETNGYGRARSQKYTHAVVVVVVVMCTGVVRNVYNSSSFEFPQISGIDHHYDCYAQVDTKCEKADVNEESH